MIGRKINNYEIVSLLGEGGMGSVYVAEHPVLGRRVAVKMLRREFAEDQALVARFMNEARAASAIRHPGIIEILDVGTLPEGIPYLMMDLLEGESLASRLFRDQRLPIDEAVAIGAQAATALGVAHAKQIVHRDLKPDNIFLVRDPIAPGGQRVVILDFGIAKLHGDQSTGSVKTRTGSVMGTPPYMSPEQCRGLTDEIDHRTDIYAMGIIVHEMLAGAPPFVGAGFGDLLMKHMTQPPAPLRSLDPRVPAHVETAVLRALEKTREARFASMEQLKQALIDPDARIPSIAPATRTMRFDEAPEGAPRHAPAERPATGSNPKLISTLTSSTGEMMAVETKLSPETEQPRTQPTLPVRRPRRVLAVAAFLIGAGGAAAAAFLFLGIGRGPDAGPGQPGHATPARPAQPIEEIAAPAMPTAAAPAAEAAPSEAEPAHRDVAAPTAKHAPASRPARGKTRGAQPARTAAASAAAAPSAAPTAATTPAAPPSQPTPPPAPPSKPTPKINTDKW